MKKNILLLPAFIFCISLHAQLPPFDWAREMGGSSSDKGNSICIDASGNVYSTGSFISMPADFDPGSGTSLLLNQGLQDVYIQKLDRYGNFVWAKSVGGAGNDVGYGIAVNAAGEVFVSGSFSQTVDFDPGTGSTMITSQGNTDAFLLKLDAAGNFAWVKTFGEVAYDEGKSLTLDAAGNCFITGEYTNTIDLDPGAGTTNKTTVGASDVFIVKLDVSGNFVWAISVGGFVGDFVSSIDVDNGGNVLIAGTYNGQVDFDPGAGTYLINGMGASDAYILKLDAAGNFVWAKAVGASLYDNAYCVRTDAANNVYACGYYSGSSIDLDPGAGTDTHANGGFEDIFVLKLDNAGNFGWGKTMSGSSGEYGYAVAVDDSGNVYTTGTFYATVDFDPSASTQNLTSSGGKDIFMQKLNASGNLVYAYKLGGSGDDVTNGLTIDAQKNLYSTGSASTTVDFNQGSGTSNLTSAGSDDAFIHKTGVLFDGVVENNPELDLVLYPNPSSGTISIQMNTEHNVQVEIADLSGKILRSEEFSAVSILTLQLDMAPGMYFVTITSGNEKAVRKIICR